MKAKTGFLAIMGLYLFFGLGYSVLMPMWEAPDEPDHYLYALFVTRENRQPPPDHNIEASQPPLYYWLASLPLRVLDQIQPALVDYYRPELVKDPDSLREFNWTPENYVFLPGPHILRWLGVAMGGLTLFFIYGGVRQFIPEQPSIALGTITLSGLSPQFLHISASISNDVLANLAGAFLFWLAAQNFAEAGHVRRILPMIFGALVFTASTKLTVLPVGLALILFSLWMATERWPKRIVPLAGTGLLVLVFGIAGFVSLFPGIAADFRNQLSFRLFYVRPDFLELGLDDLALYFAYSYWGNLGWLKIRLPPSLTILLTGFVITGWLFNLSAVLIHRTHASRNQVFMMLYGLGIVALLIGSVNVPIAMLLAASVFWQLLAVHRGTEMEYFGTWTGWRAVWLIIGLSFLALMRNVMATPQYQGRFLFPAIGAISLAGIAGWHVLLTREWLRYLLPILLLFMSAANLLLWFQSVLPVFYQPFLD